MTETVRRFAWLEVPQSDFVPEVDPKRLVHLESIFKNHGWCRQTSSEPYLWRKANPAAGQCGVTSMFVQDRFGGEIVGAVLWLMREGDLFVNSHYWNILPDGEEIDFTGEQYAGYTLVKMGPRFTSYGEYETMRAYIESSPDTLKRYHVFRQRLERLY